MDTQTNPFSTLPRLGQSNHLALNLSNSRSAPPSVAVAIAEQVKNEVIKPAFHAKLLGSDFVGGARRSTIQFQVRHQTFKCMRLQFLALKTAGADVAQMARAAGTPKFLYSNENFGLSDTALQQSRTSVASAGSNATFGKQPDIALYIIDGANGKLDPAFQAHEGPFKYWALAVWESWFTIDALQVALAQSKVKVASAKGSVRAVVAGPATALVATAIRLG